MFYPGAEKLQKLKVRYHPKNNLKMKVLFKYLRLLSLSTSGALLLCIVFAANPEIAEGTITGKVFWFHFSILLLAFSVLFMEATVKKKQFYLLISRRTFITFCRSGPADLQL